MTSNQRLGSKTVIVIGGAGLLGRSIVESLLFQGARCVVADISLESAKSVVAGAEFQEFGDQYLALECDIGNRESVDHILRLTKEKFGVVDSVINTAYPRNANYGRKFEDVEIVDFCENVSLHLGGYFLVAQRSLEFFRLQGWGNLINMASIYGVMAPRFEVYEGTSMTMPIEYSAIKAGIVNMTGYLSKYYRGHNIRVNCVSLGGLLNGQAPEFVEKYGSYCLDKGMLDAKDVTGTITFLVSEESRYINGQNLIVDDGFTL